MPAVTRYLDIDSRFRDRTIFPNPFEFQVTCTGGSAPTEPQKINDAVSPMCPIDADLGLVVTTDTFQLGAASSSVVNSYTGYYIEFYDTANVYLTYSKVIAYISGTPPSVVIDPPLSPSLVGNNLNYYFRQQLCSTSFIISASATSSVTIAQVLNDVEQYVGKYLQPSEFANDLWIESKRISSVSVDTTLGTTTFFISPCPMLAGLPPTYFSLAPTVGLLFFILDVVSNWNPLIYNGSIIGSQVPRCYSLNLCDLIISGSTPLYGHSGGAISTYPYFYLEIQGESQHTSNILVSNNPNSKRALFKIATCSDMVTTFFNLRSCTSQIIKFKPNDTFSIRLLRPDGQTLQWSNGDDLSPYPPNTLLQISLTIGFTPLPCDDNY